MKKIAIVLAIFFAFTILEVIHAQEVLTPHSIGAKVLFIDYGSLNDAEETKITNGLEAIYLRNLNKYINFGVPFKAGVIRLKDNVLDENTPFISLDAIVQFQYYKETAKLIPYIFGGGGFVLENFEASNVQFPVGLGLNYKVGKNSYLNLQGEVRPSLGDNRNNWQLGLGYIYRISKNLDSDGDTVPDNVDACPEIPGPPELAGCPDTDGDGIADDADQCPEVPGIEAMLGCPDRDGDRIPDHLDDCPDAPGTLNGCPDKDGDGVADKDDECPNTPGAIKGCPDTDGDGIADKDDACPTEPGPISNNGCPQNDKDKDGIADDVDACPDVPGPAITKGCPDRDADGVADKDDPCPDKPGPYAGCPDTDGDGLDDGKDKCPLLAGPLNNGGCPKLEKEEQEVLDLAMRAVQFETGKATLKQESYDILDKIVTILQKYPGYELKISGHTDNVGKDTNNQILSEERAQSCYDFLISRGIISSRISYTGHGELQPIATNSTSEGRRLNRRVEFELFID